MSNGATSDPFPGEKQGSMSSASLLAPPGDLSRTSSTTLFPPPYLSDHSRSSSFTANSMTSLVPKFNSVTKFNSESYLRGTPPPYQNSVFELNSLPGESEIVVGGSAVTSGILQTNNSSDTVDVEGCVSPYPLSSRGKRRRRWVSCFRRTRVCIGLCGFGMLFVFIGGVALYLNLCVLSNLKAWEGAHMLHYEPWNPNNTAHRHYSTEIPMLVLTATITTTARDGEATKPP